MNRSEILERAVNECLEEMYNRAQPSVSFNKIVEDCKNGVYNKNEAVYERYYLSAEEYKEILENYIEAYKIHDDFQENCDIVYKYLAEGGLKDSWVPGKVDENGFKHSGYRSYENTPKITDIMAEDDAKKCLDLINECKKFYCFNREENNFHWTIMNYSPSSNKESVREYWKTNGVDIKFKKRVYNEEIDDYEYIDDDE